MTGQNIANNKISIITANRNKEKYLSACINSVLDQDYSDFELIIIDDKSDDNSLDIIRSYHDGRIRTIVLDKNVGVAKARNIGIKNANGHYITTLDSDDVYLAPNKLRSEFNLLKKYEATGKTIIAFSNVVRLTEEGKKYRIISKGKSVIQGNLFKGLLKRSIFIPRDFLCKKSVLEDVGLYNETLRIYEDWDLKLRIAKYYEYYFTYVLGVGYRDTSHGLAKLDAKIHGECTKYIRDKWNKAN